MTYYIRESWENEHGGAPVKCILDVSKNLRYYFDMAMSVDGMTGMQMRLLGHLRMKEALGECVYQKEIEEIFRIKRSSVTSVLQTLEKKNMIIRESVPGDARIKKLVLTDKARAIQTCSFQRLTEMEQQMRSLFSEEEFQNFLDYMNRIDQKATEIYNSKEEKHD